LALPWLACVSSLPWQWAGAGLALLIFLPNLAWQVQNHFVSLEFLQSIHFNSFKRYIGKKMKSQIASTSKGPIEYTLQGEGPVVLVCHGTSSNCFSAELAGPLIEAGFSVLIPSRPGYGRTPSEVGRDNLQAAGALAALLDSLEIQACSVVAISGGGPTGVALAAAYPERVQRLALIEANTHTEGRQNEPAYRSQKAFYGPLHGVRWGLLGLTASLAPQRMARQTLAIFSSHDPDDAMKQLSVEDITAIRCFYQGRSSRQGALNDLRHSVGAELLQKVPVPALIVHSREDASIPFSHAEWSLQHIPNAELYEGGSTGHFYWIGPDYAGIRRRLVAFLRSDI
jgi:pimeloyl-ACP methyl ester carboxylesterase